MNDTTTNTKISQRTRVVALGLIAAGTIFAAAAIIFGFSKSSSNTSTTEIRLSGVVRDVVIDTIDRPSGDQYYLETPDGQHILLSLPTTLPAPGSGDNITVTGSRHGDTFSVTSVMPTNNTTAEVHAASLGSVSALSATPTEYHVLVVMGYYSGQAVPTTPTQSDVQTVMFGSSPSVADFYQDNSFGHVHVTGIVTPWIPVTGSESGNINTSASMALQAAKTADPTLDLKQFQHVVFISPYTSNTLPDAYSVVGPLSVSSPDGPLTISVEMVRSTINQLPRTTLLLPYILIHEFGHGLGLGHAGLLGCTDVPIATTCRVMEYADRFDVMGGAYELSYAEDLNAAHLDKLGWLDSSNLQLVDVNPGQGGTYTLEPIENRTTGLKALKIPRGNDDYFYVEYRQPIGYDTAIDDPLLFTGALLHVLNFGSYPNSLGSDTLVIDPNQHPSAFKNDSLKVGSSLTDPITGVVITTTAQDANGVTVRVDPATKPIVTDLPPTVTITAPQSGSTVTSPVTFSATIDDDHGVSTSRFYVDCPATSSLASCSYTYQGYPYQMSKVLATGAHSIQVTADDYTGHRTSSPRVVFTVGTAPATVPATTVTPPTVPPPTTTIAPPIVAVSGLVNGKTAVGQKTTLVVKGTTSTISSAVLKVDGKNVYKRTTAPFSFYVDSPAYPNGAHTVSLVVTQTNGVITTKNVTVVTSNSLSVSISAPAKNAKVKKSVIISPTVRGGYGTKSIAYTLDGKKLATTTKTPFSYSWNTTKTKIGTHTITVKVTDKKGKTASASVKVKVTR